MGGANTFDKTNEKEFGNCLSFRSARCQEGGEKAGVEDHQGWKTWSRMYWDAIRENPKWNIRGKS